MQALINCEHISTKEYDKAIYLVLELLVSYYKE